MISPESCQENIAGETLENDLGGPTVVVLPCDEMDPFKPNKERDNIAETLGEDAELHVDEARPVVAEGGTVVAEGGTVVATDRATVVAADGVEVVPADENPAVPGLDDAEVQPPRAGAGEPR